MRRKRVWAPRRLSSDIVYGARPAACELAPEPVPLVTKTVGTRTANR
jgi:hypothetical protein